MRFWLLILLGFGISSNADEIGSISEFRGNGEVVREGDKDKLLAELSLGILSYDDVRTGNGRMAIEFLDSSVLRLTEHSKVVIDNYIFDPDPDKSRLALNMASGTARLSPVRWVKSIKRIFQYVHPALRSLFGVQISLLLLMSWAVH